MSGEQISFIGKEYCTEKEVADLERQAERLFEYAKKKGNWENAWSVPHAGNGTQRRMRITLKNTTSALTAEQR